MSRAKVIIVALVAALAVSVVGSPVASAATAGWMVGGTNLTGTAALATTAAVDKNGVLRFSSLIIECTGKTLNGVAPLIESTNKGSVTSLGFTGCATVGGKCTLVGTTINTLPISVEATLDGLLAVTATFKPKAGTLFTTLLFTGATCAFGNEVLGLSGHVAVLVPTGQDERTLQQINVAAAGTELFLDESPLTFEGSALLRLASGKTWSFL
ncbi:MAG TPA: hypothetical protein VGL57_00155 [Solirubrobacteraceae bacterium]|jgi:hypothetical protein